jgi:hypothetical protein
VRVRKQVEAQQRIVNFITRANWVYLALAAVLGILFASGDIARGIVAGGLIVTINFHLLSKTLRKSLTPPHLSSHPAVLAKYYLRFVISMALIFLMIWQQWVNPLGLIIGLSIVVTSILSATFLEIKRLFCKEAV